MKFLLRLLGASLLAAPLATPAPSLQKRTISRDGNPGLIGAGVTSYPRATKLASGMIVSCYTSFSNGNTVLNIAQSADGGWNWSTIGSVASATTATRDLDNCNVLALPSGRILAAFRNHDRATASSTPTFYRLTVCYSDDGGVSWSFLSTAQTSGTPLLGLWEPFLQNSLSGAVRMYYSYETKTDSSNQNNYVITSTDGGVTWGSPVLVSSCGSSSCRDGMVGVARIGTSSNLVAVFESLSPDSGVHSVKSSDDGATWGSRAVVWYSSTANVDQGAPQIAYINGNLVTSFQTNEDSPGSSTWNIKVVVSTDSGNTWGQETTVLDACLWAGQLTVDTTHLLVMCSLPGGDSLAQTMLLS